MIRHYSARDVDWVLLGITMAITILGLLEIYSATRNTPWQEAHLKQMMWIGLGLILLWVFSAIDYNILIHHAPAFYVIAVALLLLIMVLGQVIGGARRWLPMPGGATLQVSEFVKVVLVLLMARFFSDLHPERVSVKNLLKIAGLFAVPMFLVARQPDLSTALSYAPILFMGVFVAGLRWKYVLVLVVAGALILPLAWQYLQPYQKERLITFMDPERDPRGSGYQPIQSKIAVGAGGIWGSGFAQGSQTQLRFLPVPHTDFIFSAYAEETGFVGVTLILALYFSMLMKIAGNAQTSADSAGMFLCMGAGALLLFHLLVNIGMVIGRMPVTGLPLPLMSYGGSNLLATFMLLGLVNNVRLRRFTN